MIAELICRNVYTWSLQMAILIAAGGLVCLALRFGPPRARLLFWHALLAASLLLPLLPVRRLVDATPKAGATFRISLLGTPARSALPAHTITQAILLALAAGAVLRLAWLALGSLQLRRYRLRATFLSPAPATVRQICGELATAGDFYLSRDVTSPVTFGFRHQTVLLPRNFFQLDPESQRVILCHELLHLRRNDWLFMVAEELVRAVFWFHPAIWWLLAQIQLTREQAVDHAVIAHTRDRDGYVDALLAMALTQVRADLAPAPLFLRKRQLAQRVASLIRGANMSKRRFIASLATMASVVAMTAALTLWQFPLAAAEQPEKNDGNVVQPQLLTKVMPVYPPEAKAAGIDGMVILEVMLDKTGHPESVKAVEGPKELMQSAVDAVEQWTWSPATHNGEPVSVKSRVQINYTLDKPNQKSEKSADKPAN